MNWQAFILIFACCTVLICVGVVMASLNRWIEDSFGDGWAIVARCFELSACISAVVGASI